MLPKNNAENHGILVKSGKYVGRLGFDRSSIIACSAVSSSVDRVGRTVGGTRHGKMARVDGSTVGIQSIR
ncbi:hypothetical protein PM082_014934 [Marasmius tenuissimus]|nr:hypothetical protein PM082_014934 [Marasmius tenuissimus]